MRRANSFRLSRRAAVRIVTPRLRTRAGAVTEAELTGATTMFIHRNRGRNAQAVSLGLLAAALISTVVSAADQADAFVLVAYSNRAGGTQIANGEYLSATQVTRAGVPEDRGALATNHCVAFAMSEQLGKAQLACDSAVQAAFCEQAELPSWNARSRAQAANSQAVAYSNRAVLRWLNADAQGARQDLAKAQALAPPATFVIRNMSAMQSHENATPARTASLAKAAQE
jgi:hypothetical protein